jgi:hypothetical protein
MSVTGKSGSCFSGIDMTKVHLDGLDDNMPGMLELA